MTRRPSSSQSHVAFVLAATILTLAWPAHSGNFWGGTATNQTNSGDEGDGPQGCDPKTASGRTDPVNLLTGEFFISGAHHLTPDPVIRGRGLSLDFTRTYRSRFGQNGVVGFGWDLRIHKRLRQRSDGTTTTLVVSTGTCRELVFTPVGDPVTSYDSPLGTAAELTDDGSGHILTFANGTTWKFDANGLITAHEDRHGNAITYTWSSEPEPIHGVPRFLIDALLPLPAATSEPFFDDDFSSLLVRDYRLESVSDPAGRSVTLTYDSDTGRLSTIEDWENRVWTYEQDVLGNLEQVKAPPIPGHPIEDRARTTYVYNDTVSGDPHNLTEIITPNLQGTSPQEYFLSQTYDVDGRVDEQTLADGAVFDISYDAPAAGQTTVNDGNGVDTVYTFDGNGRLTSEKVNSTGLHTADAPFPGDPASFETTFQYDSLGRLTLTTFPDGRSVERIYAGGVDPSPKERGNVAEVRIREAGVDPPDEPFLATSFTYTTPFNQIETITEPNQNAAGGCSPPDDTCKTVYSYNETTHNLEKIALPLPRPAEERPEIEFTWNGHGQLTHLIDANDSVTLFEYDQTSHYLDEGTRGHDAPEAAVTEFNPDDLGRPTQVIDPNGETTDLTFNDWDLIEIVSPPDPNIETTYHYDGNRDLERIERASTNVLDGSQTTTFGYTARNQLETIADEFGEQTEFSYDGNGNRNRIEDAEENPTVFVFDERNLVFTVTDAASRTTRFDYHPSGALFRVKDGEGRNTLYGYDEYDRLNLITHAATSQHPAKTESFLYDDNSNLERATNRDGVTIEYVYDALDRLRERTVDPGGAAVEVMYTYDAGGRLDTVDGPTIDFDFDYDALNQLTVEQVTSWTGYTGSVPFSIQTARDGAGNLTALTHPDGTAFKYVPDALDRLDAIQDPTGTTTFVSFAYDDLSLLTAQLFQSGAQTTAEYDDAGRVDVIRHFDAAPAVLAVLDYTLDPTGAVTSIDDDPDPGAGVGITYGYDTTKQLTSVVYPAGHPFDAEDTTWLYDGAGNRTSEQIGSTPTVVPYVPNDLNQYDAVDSVARTYDANGNLTSDGSFTYHWDAENQLTEVRDASDTTTIATYAYDPFGRRVQKTAGGAARFYVWSGDRLLEEHDESGALAARYTYGTGFAPVQMRTYDPGESVYDVHTDHLDTPRRLTDASGAEQWSAEYAAFGEASVDGASTVALNIRFPGQYFDAETGLHYNRFRYYDPGTGRYISADPIGQFGIQQLLAALRSPGSTALSLNSTANLHTYGLNRPASMADPQGLGIRDFIARQILKRIGGAAGGKIADELFGNGPLEDEDEIQRRQEDTDTDGDRIPDAWDSDDDDDGISDPDDPDPTDRDVPVERPLPPMVPPNACSIPDPSASEEL